MTADNKLQARIEPVAAPPSHPGNEHIVGNRIRWAIQVIKYQRYQRYLRRTGQHSLSER
jgi:hypothetical protein